MIATIKPRRIELYINTAKKTLAQIKKETGATHIINGGSFTSFSRPDCQLKANGKVYVNDGYTYWGYAWDTAEDFSPAVVPCAKQNYIALICMLRNGENEPMNIKPAYGGCRQRTAIGKKADGSIVLYCTQSGRYPEQVREEMRAAGCVDAVLLDGGESSQCDFDGWVLKSDRIVHNLILIWADTDTEEGRPNLTDTDTEGGVPKLTDTLRRGSSGPAVVDLQNNLTRLGCGRLDTDGSFGPATESAVKEFQKDMGLSVDGIYGPASSAMMVKAAKCLESAHPLVSEAVKCLGLSEPNEDDPIISEFNRLAGTNFGGSVSWCQIFAVVMQSRAGYEPYLTASCTIATNYYKLAGKWKDSPSVGYLAYIDWDKSGDSDHVGIVAGIDGSDLFLIEGNSGGLSADAVRLKRYSLPDLRIRGYADVKPVETNQSESAYDWAVRNGWISAKFKPGDLITVELLCAVLKRLKGNT